MSRVAAVALSVCLTIPSAVGCNPAPPSTTGGPPEEDPSIPRPAPVGTFAEQPGAAPAAPPAPGADARGLVGPTGALGVEVYRARRRAVMERASGAAVLVVNEASWSGARDGMDFYWLTGIEEEGAALLLTPGAPYYKETLFLEQRDPEGDRWHGERASIPNKALEVASGIGRIQRKGSLVRHLMAACERHGALAFVGEFKAIGKDEVLDLYREASGKMLGCQIRDLHGTLARLRSVHDDAELALMRKAIEYTKAGHAAALAAMRPGLREYEVKDVIETAFRRAGSRHLAFESITGSGPNAAVLHYPKDDRAMKDGEVIVIDVGAEAEMYAADVTRTLPVGGKYTAEQREIVDVVLRAQQAGIDAARPGATMEQVDLAARKVIEQAGYYDHFWHYCCHYVGLEVHDAGVGAEPLAPGMVITVEPGIYLPHRGFGVRIEDQVLITDTGNEVLTASIPKRPDEIEAAMAARKP
jgi:Xaa-Pro aminopeptidase